jgi:serine/threonine-protein kinase RsbW
VSIVRCAPPRRKLWPGAVACATMNERTFGGDERFGALSRGYSPRIARVRSRGMIEIVVDIRKPQLHLRLPAEADSLPVVRQALRSLGEAVRADRVALDDAELAVTEACANVVEHAYVGETGAMEVRFEPGAAHMAVTVADHGLGMAATKAPAGDRGFGLSMIEGIADRLEVSGRPGGGTEVAMSLAMGGEPLSLNGTSPPDAAPLERIARRIVAVIAAQTDMPADRFVESLLAVELAARHAPGYLTGDRVHLTLERLSGGFDFLLGPLVANGARALVHESELPVVGAVIERLSDEVSTERSELEPATERLRLRIDSGSARSPTGLDPAERR